MADVNNVVMSGRLVRDAENKTLPSGTQLVVFDMANNTGFGEYAKTIYFTVNLWGKAGQNIYQYLTKGKSIIITGKLEVQRWQQEGIDRQKNVINCSDIVLQGSSSSSTQEYHNDDVTF